MKYVGLDYHTEMSYVSVLDDENEEIFEGSMYSQFDLPKFLETLDAPQVLFEAGYGWPRLAKMLEETDVDLRMCHPEQNRRIAKDRRKSDRRDAKNLAVYLKTETYKSSWMPSADVRDERQLVRGYISITRSLAGIRNRIRSLLAYAGMPKEGFAIFAKKDRMYLESIELEPNSRLVLDALIESFDFQTEQKKQMEKLIAKMNQNDHRAKLLKTIPGVGDITARTVLAQIGDISRFPTAKSLACYAGLTPGQRQSSDRNHRTGITKEGCADIRWLLIQASWINIRYDPAMKQFYEKKAGEKNKNIAICAVARKLTVAMWHILKKQVPFKARRPDAGQPVAIGKPAVGRGKTEAVIG